MKKASKPAPKAPAKKASTAKNPAAKPKAKPAAKPKRKAQSQAELTQVVARLEAIAEKLAQAADRITEATAANPQISEPAAGERATDKPQGESEEDTFKTLRESGSKIESTPVLVRHTRSE